MPSHPIDQSSADEPDASPRDRGTQLTSEMQEKLETARVEHKTSRVAVLMQATGASLSNVRTWLQNRGNDVALGRPRFFFREEEDTMAVYFASWTKGGDALTCGLASVLLRQYIADVGREAEAGRCFGVGGIPGRTFLQRFLEGRPEQRRVRPVALEGVRAVASTLEAVAKFFAAFWFLCTEFAITKASQVWNTDESMMNAEELMSKSKVKVIAHKDDGRPEFVIPSVQSGAEATSLVATICTDESCLLMFVVVAGSGGRLRFAVVEQVAGFSRRVPLASFLEDGAEVHRREKPGFDWDLRETFARSAARHLAGRGGAEWKVMLMDGCKVHASAVGLRLLNDAKVVVLMFLSHLSHMLQALDGQSFLKNKARSVTGTGAMLPILPRGAKFNLIHLKNLINQSACHGLSSVNIITGFRETGTWPI
eukprot:contig_16521_g4006